MNTPGEADHFRSVRSFMLAYERGLVRTEWRRKVAKHITELEEENARLTDELKKKTTKAKPKPSTDSE